MEKKPQSMPTSWPAPPHAGPAPNTEKSWTIFRLFKSAMQSEAPGCWSQPDLASPEDIRRAIRRAAKSAGMTPAPFARALVHMGLRTHPDAFEDTPLQFLARQAWFDRQTGAQTGTQTQMGAGVRRFRVSASEEETLRDLAQRWRSAGLVQWPLPAHPARSKPGLDAAEKTPEPGLADWWSAHIEPRLEKSAPPKSRAQKIFGINLPKTPSVTGTLARGRRIMARAGLAKNARELAAEQLLERATAQKWSVTIFPRGEVRARWQENRGLVLKKPGGFAEIAVWPDGPRYDQAATGLFQTVEYLDFTTYGDPSRYDAFRPLHRIVLSERQGDGLLPDERKIANLLRPFASPAP